MTTATETRTPAPAPDASAWARANQAYLEGEVERLRLLLRRRVLWLRRCWRHDPVENFHHQVISEAQADGLLAAEAPEAESRFYAEDPEATALGRAIRDQEDSLHRQRQAMAAESTLPALEVLTRLLDLGPVERQVLVLCVAPELDPALLTLYAYVQDDMVRKYATAHLAGSLFGGEEGLALRDAFHPEAPLRRFRMVTVEPAPLPASPLGARPLRLDDRIAEYLRGVNRLDGRVVGLLRPWSPGPQAPLPTCHRELVERLGASLEAGAGEAPLPAVNLTGPAGAGKRGVARALAEGLGADLCRLDALRLPTPGSGRQELLRLLEREAVLLQLAFYVDAVDIDVADKAAKSSISDLVEHLGAFVIVGSRERWRSDRSMLEARVSKPDAGAQRILWEAALAGACARLNGHVESLVQQFDLGPQAIAEAVATARVEAGLRVAGEDGKLGAEDLWQVCRRQSCGPLGELAQRIEPCYGWEDIVLPGDVFGQLREIAAQVAQRPRVYETWGFGKRLSRGRGISALFAGPSGTGKTMAAEVLANHLALDLYRIDLAGVVSKYIGETEKNLRKVFDAAEASGAILFFDEADALFGKRTEVKDSHDRYANIEVNYLLQRMEDYRGLAILATNRKSSLDRAFLRRLRFLVDFPFPDAASRRRIWRKVFPREAALDGVDYEALAQLEMPGGNVRNVALNAAFLAADEDQAIGMDHLMHAARREYSKMEKLVTQGEFGSYFERVKA